MIQSFSSAAAESLKDFRLFSRIKTQAKIQLHHFPVFGVFMDTNFISGQLFLFTDRNFCLGKKNY